MPGFVVCRCDRADRPGGGLCIYMKDSIMFEVGRLSRLIDSNQIKSIQVANRLIDSKLLNRFTETIHYFYLFNGIVARKCQQIDFYLT